MTDWREYRPAIWTAMLGVAVTLTIGPVVGVLLLGGSIGLGAKIYRRRRLRR